jgi:hypothetical protein
MRSTLLIALCCVSLIAVVFNLLLIRPVATSATSMRSPDVHIAMIRATYALKTVQLNGDSIVGFSCVGEPEGVACYIASR